MNAHKNLPYIEHILDTIKNIENSTSSLSKEEFESNKDIVDATIRRIEVIGEAIKNISKILKEKYPQVKWKEIVRTRDKIIHQYFGVNLNIIWEIVKKDIPILNKQMQKIKKGLT